jgi:hypothetical protein
MGGASYAITALHSPNINCYRALLAKLADDACLLAEAKVKGYEDDMCSECGNFTLVRNGTYMKCGTCGSMTGCS